MQPSWRANVLRRLHGTGLAKMRGRWETIGSTVVSMDIVFRTTEAGYAWYVWSPASGDIHPFGSAEEARRFARRGAARAPDAHAKCFDVQGSLEQGATLI
jgi:hypothetical protein